MRKFIAPPKLSILLYLLLAFLAVKLLIQPLVPSQSDLPRHIMNGQVIINSLLEGDWPNLNGILHTNYYSWVTPNYPFINHHWGSGVIFYILFKIGSFEFVHFFSVVVWLMTFLVLWGICRNLRCIRYVWLSFLIILPLVVFRNEVRPEIFSNLFLLWFIYMVTKIGTKPVPKPIYGIIFISQLLWANVHVYYFFGLGIICLWLVIGGLHNRRRRFYQEWLMLLLIALVASVITPFGWRGLLFPFQIFQDYGYTVVENLSFFGLAKYSILTNYLGLMMINTVFIPTIFLTLVVLKNQWRNAENLFILILTVCSSAFAFFANRNLTLYGLIACVAVAMVFKLIADRKPLSLPLWLLVLIYLGFSFNLTSPYLRNLWQSSAFGLEPGAMGAVDFVNAHNLSGPLFNNYDIGSLLVYGLKPQLKVMVDNRPEAYGKEYFNGFYIPIQLYADDWAKIDKRVNFNLIVVEHNDMTDWGKVFIHERLIDSAWAVVFRDQHVLVMLKRNSLNDRAIADHELKGMP